jgi:hypothetical protein
LKASLVARVGGQCSRVVSSSARLCENGKGKTSGYWSGLIGETVHPDLAWCYDFPTRQLLAISGLIAFYNEKVDVIIDGQRLSRPVTHFSRRLFTREALIREPGRRQPDRPMSAVRNPSLATVAVTGAGMSVLPDAAGGCDGGSDVGAALGVAEGHHALGGIPAAAGAGRRNRVLTQGPVGVGRAGTGCRVTRQSRSRSR